MSITLPIKGDSDKKIGAYNAPLSVSAQDVPNMTVRIRAGSFYNSENVLTEYAGGNSPIVSVPPSGAKWVVVGLSDQGSIVLTQGTNQSLPQMPVIPTGVLPLAAIYVSYTAVSLTNALIQDVRPFLRTIDAVPNVDQALEDRPTFTDVENLLATKADINGTPALDFFLNNSFTAGSPSASPRIAVRRGSYGEPAIRWSEPSGRWEISNDGQNYGGIATTGGTFAPIDHTHVVADVTDFAPAVQAIVSASAIAQSQVTGLVTDLGEKASANALQAHADDTSIHHTLPLPQTAITGLQTDLASKMDNAGGVFTGDITVHPVGKQPITLSSSDSGSSGLSVARGVSPEARFEWDESAGAWMAGAVGSMNTVLTGNVAVGSVNGKTGVVSLSNVDVGAAATVHTHTSSQITDFNTAVTALIPADAVSSVNTKVGAVVLSASDVGAAPTVHTHTASQITDFSTAVTALIPADAVTSVNTKTGAVVLAAVDVGAAATVHTHVASDITNFNAAVTALIPADAVASVNTKTGAVVLSASDVGAAPAVHTHTSSQITDFNTAVTALIPADAVTSVNTKTGAVVLSNTDVGAAATVHTHVAADITNFNTAVDARIGLASINALSDVVITSPNVDQQLTFDGTNWKNTTINHPLLGSDTSTSATPVVISVTNVAADTVVTGELVVKAIEVASGNVYGRRMFFLATNAGGTVTVHPSTADDEIKSPSGLTWDVQVQAVGASFEVHLIGEAGKTIQWNTTLTVR